MKRLAAALLALLPAAAWAATPPALLNYQGVLRDASNRPLDGTYDMVFAFYDAETSGNQILVDQHAAATANAVTVSNGLFDVTLGGGTVTDGSGPGVYTSLTDVFRDYGSVYLEIKVGAETLNPRVQVLSSGYALDAANLGGKPPDRYLDTSSTSQSKAGPLTVTSTAPSTAGLTATGAQTAGYFYSGSNSGLAYVGYGDYGVWAQGNGGGGYFRATLPNSGYAYLGHYDDGIDAYGNNTGGYFQDLVLFDSAYLASNGDGIQAHGSTQGGYFNDSGTDVVHLATGGFGVNAVGASYGIHAVGSSYGGWFQDSNSSGYAYVGNGDDGIDAFGNAQGGYFKDANNSGYAHVGYGDRGIEAYGNEMGGYFSDNNSTGLAKVALGDRGIWGYGSFAGGTFSDPNGTVIWADLGRYDGYSVVGNGAKAFEQNHPYEKDKVITYAALEGDEVAVYTRGSAKLVDGEARVTLGDTFRLVTDPDIGLTAHLTPRGGPASLWVASVTPSELVVRGPAGSDAAFDYLVFGLRIGFEEMPIVRPKDREAFLPDAAAIQEPYRDHPELRSSSALSRFTKMGAAMGIAGEPDLARAHALASAIDANRAEIVAAAGAATRKERARSEEGAGPATGTRPVPSATQASGSSVRPDSPSSMASSPPALPAGAAPVPVAGEVDSGDVLAIDPSAGLVLRRAAGAFDPRVVGIVTGDAGETWMGTAPLALAGTIVACHVDASYGAILPGDLLAASPTPGYAMRAGTAPVQGTVVAKALEPLASGTGTIRVLAMPR